MHPLDHWHPVLRSRALGRSPLRVLACGEELVLFRIAGGRVGALQHECPHRRMPLSEGRVRGESLVCAYHGWQFTPEGGARCPAMPGAAMTITSFEVVEGSGLIWLKNRTSGAALPDLEPAGRIPVCQVQALFRAPLELVADNLAEMEHTGETHLFFGYDTDRMHEVEVVTELGDDYVRVVARGPQRRLPALLDAARRIAGSASDDLFVDDLYFRFSPLHVVSDGYWEARGSGARRPDGLHSKVFFLPRTASETELFAFYYLSHGSSSAARLLRPLLRRIIRLELERDRRVTERVASRRAGIEGLQLSRFDAPLLEIRRRIAESYGSSMGIESSGSHLRCRSTVKTGGG
jgi:nitrite reductase/ring-hydroxylating ferredoxin subunit